MSRLKSYLHRIAVHKFFMIRYRLMTVHEAVYLGIIITITFLNSRVIALELLMNVLLTFFSFKSEGIQHRLKKLYIEKRISM